MAIRTSIKEGGVWKDAKDIYIKDGGTWKRGKSVYIKDSGTWKKTHSSTWSYTFTSNATNVNISQLAGIDPFYDIEITINPGVYIYSTDVNTYAMRTGTGFGGILTVINNGYIYGAGGKGGQGCHNGANAGNAREAGSPAFYAD